jgi:hypothetical protein
MGYECVLDECVDGCFCVKGRKRTIAVASHPYAFASSSRIRWRSLLASFSEGRRWWRWMEGNFSKR